MYFLLDGKKGHSRSFWAWVVSQTFRMTTTTSVLLG
jgi:hypothetical protein